MISSSILSEPYIWAAEDENPYVSLIRSYIKNELNTQLHYLAQNYIQLNPIARKRYLEFIDLAGNMLDMLEPASISNSSRENILLALDEFDEAAENLNAPFMSHDPFLGNKPASLNVDDMPWRSKGRHAYQAKCPDAPMTKYWRVDPNSECHQPKPKRTEYILIIDGALLRDNRLFEVGSLYISPTGDAQQLPSCPERGCVYLNVSDASRAGLSLLLSHFLHK